MRNRNTYESCSFAQQTKYSVSEQTSTQLDDMLPSNSSEESEIECHMYISSLFLPDRNSIRVTCAVLIS